MSKRGINVFDDISESMPGFSPNVFFDIGANIGQSTIEFLEKYPEATIYAFEPVLSTYYKLEKNLSSIKNCRLFNIGMSENHGVIKMLSDLHRPTRSKVIDGSEPINPGKMQEIVDVEIDCIDRFCEANNIRQVDFLKIDAEGHDMKILLGGVKFLSQGRNKILMIEAGMNPDNDLHVPFMEIYNYLQGFGYYLFGIYDQKEEWIKKQPHLRRANLVFINCQNQE